MMATLREVSHVGEYIGEGRGDITDDDMYEDEHQQNLGGAVVKQVIHPELAILILSWFCLIARQLGSTYTSITSQKLQPK